MSDFKYKLYEVIMGKFFLLGLFSMFGCEDEVEILVLYFWDSYSFVVVDLYYFVFLKYDVIVWSVKIMNKGSSIISVEKLVSFSVDFLYDEYEML